MAAVGLTVAGELDIVEAPPGGTHTGICNVAIAAGEVIRQDSTTGKWVKSLATTAANAQASYIATRSAPEGGQLTGMRHGVLRGFNISALGYGASLFISDTAGGLADVAGTVSIVAGTVLGQFGELRGVAPAKLLLVKLP